MKDDKDIPMKAEVELISLSKALVKPWTVDDAFRVGGGNAFDYEEDELIEMLERGNIEEAYEAMGAISKRKLKKALPYLKNIVLYDDSKGVQEEAICTIRRIGGKKALDILRFLKTTEHKEFIEEILREGV